MIETRQPVEERAARMQPLARLPVFLALDGKRALVAGEGAAAAWKVELLSAAGARVDVYAVQPCDELMALESAPPRGAVTIHRRTWDAADFAEAAIAVGQCETKADATVFADAARTAGVPVNVIDKPAFCDFSFGAIVNRSPLVIGISSDGAAPVFTQAIRAKLEALLPQGFAAWAAAASRWRGALKRLDLSFAGRRKFWQGFTARAIAEPNRVPAEDDFESLVEAVRGLGNTVENGSVTLVGAGPGDPELLTLRAVRALQSADVILFDRLVSPAVLDFARREAKKMLVGKTGYGPSCRQDEINALMVNLAKSGRRVVRLKGGDPLIFSRAHEELDACAGAGIAVEVVPGITAAQGAASRLGMPLTGRGKAQRLQLVTGHSRAGALPDEVDWTSLADPAATTAIYMPVHTLPPLVAHALAAGLDPDTPAVAVARATMPDQQIIRSRIAELPVLLADMALPGPVLVMVGAVVSDARDEIRDVRGETVARKRSA